MLIVKILNEDGTFLFEGYPKNPLLDKYPPLPKPEYSQICDGYSCDWCGRCPHGSLWEVPDEDKKAWKQYLKEVDEYNKRHNPSMFKIGSEINV